MREILRRAAICAALMVALPLGAQAQLTPGEQAASDAKEGQIQRQGRAEIEALFARLCPGRCELVDFQVVMEEPEPVGEVSPGFESVTKTAFEAKPKAITTVVLLDAKMPANFRKNMPRLIEYRLAELAPVVRVRTEQLNFPEPQLQPMPPLPPEPEAQAPEPPQEPLPEAPPKQEDPPKEEPQAEAPKPDEEPWWQKALRALGKELLPWIPFLVTILIMGAMVLYLLRKLREIEEAARAGGARAAGDEGAGDDARGPDRDALRGELRKSRAVQNQVLRRWLLEDPEAVAGLVRMLGPEILNDLKGDSGLRPALETVSEAVTASGQPLSLDDQRRLAREVRARLTAARVLHDEAGMSADWEFLEGAALANLKRIMGRLAVNESSFVIGQLPPALRASYLEGLGPQERRDLFINTSGGDLLSKDQALDLARRVRKALDDLAHIGSEARGQAQIVGEMIAALPLRDQEQTLRELASRRPEVAQAVLSQTVLESATLHAPAEALADTLFRMPIETLAQFVRGTREDVAAHLLEVAPGNVRPALVSELQLEIPVSRADFLQAREEFTRTLAVVLKRDGHDVAPLNVRALRGESAGGGDTEEVSA